MNWTLFLSIFSLIFLAELPDKTAFATLLLAAQGRASAVLTGVAAAFFVQTVVAVLFGSAISLLPETWIHVGSGLLFIGFAVHSWRESRKPAESEDERTHSHSIEFWPTVQKSFLVIFIAEWGDLTQIATASLTAKYPDHKLTVFSASVAALWAVTVAAVFLGKKAEAFIKPKRLQQVSAVLFLGIGAYFIFGAWSSRP